MCVQGKERHGKDAAEHITKVSTTDARQGVTPHVTRYVLSWGLALVIVAFSLVYALSK